MNGTSKQLTSTLSLLTMLACAAGIVSAFTVNEYVTGQLFVVGLVLFAMRIQFSTQWSTFAFSIWVLASWWRQRVLKNEDAVTVAQAASL